ncbi:MAG: DUF3365 domain-containing protein [Xanthomonadales bacterium]
MNAPLKPLFALLALLALPPSVAQAEASPPEQARAAVQAFAAALKGELMAAMQTGGPIAAIEVCNTRAPAIAEAVSLEQGVEVHRVSLKNRNPQNAPSDWQRDVLLQFEERKAAGEDPAALTWTDTVATPTGDEYRFMKAIPTGGLCLGCHGQAIAPAVAEKIAELYPQDAATGYREGDIRGAFVVIDKS